MRQTIEETVKSEDVGGNERVGIVVKGCRDVAFRFLPTEVDPDAHTPKKLVNCTFQKRREAQDEVCKVSLGDSVSYA